MIDRPFREILDELAARTPTPGGGAASAMAGTLGTALLLMVVRFSRGKKANAAREGDLEAVEQALVDLQVRLLPMAERDSAAFERVSAAYGIPKSDAEVRARAIQEAMVGAIVAPEECLHLLRDVLVAAAGVRDCIGRAILSDLAAGARLVLAGAEGSFLNVRINCAYLEDRERAAAALGRSQEVLDEARRVHDQLIEVVDAAL